MKPRVLIAEDDSEVMFELIKLLETSNFELVTKDNGACAFSTICNNNPNFFDLIITDHRMPQMKGLEMVEQLKTREFNIPIIMISTFPKQFFESYIENNCINAFLPKPVEEDVLLSTIVVA